MPSTKVSPVTGQEYTPDGPVTPTAITLPYPAIEQLTEDQKEFMHYVFTTALEGGIGYWSVCQQYSWSVKEPTPSGGYIVGDDLDGFYAVITSPEADQIEPDTNPDEYLPGELDPGWGVANYEGNDYPAELTIDMVVIHRGVGLYLQGIANGEYGNPYTKQFFIQWLTDMEDGDSDADAADACVQLGLFGEVVYS